MSNDSERGKRRRKASFRMVGACALFLVVESLLWLVLPMRVWIYQSFIALAVFIVVIAFIVFQLSSEDRPDD